MANPKPPLAGIGDPGDPNWRENVMARVAASQTERGHGGQSRRRATIQVFFDPPFAHMLKIAAQQRDIATGAYARRAIAAFIAHDLGLEFSEVTRYLAEPTRYAQPQRYGPGGVRRTSDDGTGHGSWDVR